MAKQLRDSRPSVTGHSKATSVLKSQDTDSRIDAFRKLSVWVVAAGFALLALIACSAFVPIAGANEHSPSGDASASGQPVANSKLKKEFDADAFQTQIYNAVKKALPGVVAVNDRGGTFSAVIVSTDGLVLSAGHAVTPNRRYTLYLSDGRRVSALGLGSNDRVDCAMLKITKAGPWPTVELGDSSSLVANQPCISISHPGRYDAKRGPVVRLGHVIDPITSNGMIQSSAKMEPGDSGGPLLDINGRVIGIHSNIRLTVDRNYDVPVAAFKKYWDELKTPKTFEASDWPSLPILGFQVLPNEAEDAVEVTKILKGGIAEKAGMKVSDEIVAVAARRIKKNADLTKLFKTLASQSSKRFKVEFRRDNKPRETWFQLPVDQQEAVPEVAKLEKQFVKLESRLDDTVISINSSLNGTSTMVRGTRIKAAGGGNLVSKNSRVGEAPKIRIDGKTIPATVIRRDPENDLVLLSAKFPTATKNQEVDLSFLPGDMLQEQGKLLLSPDSNGAGIVSVWGTKYFNIKKSRQSGGYLGVQLGTRDNQVILEMVQRKLAAAKAGLAQGDVLLKIDDKKVKGANDVFEFLRSAMPNETISLLVSRDGTELEKQVVLGRRPEESRHIADRLPGGKSVRRDGFKVAVSHDADIRPEQCGGPVFDLKGDFLGINMARNSRVRCYVVPKTVIENFVNQR